MNYLLRLEDRRKKLRPYQSCDHVKLIRAYLRYGDVFIAGNTSKTDFLKSVLESLLSWAGVRQMIDGSRMTCTARRRHHTFNSEWPIMSRWNRPLIITRHEGSKRECSLQLWNSVTSIRSPLWCYKVWHLSVEQVHQRPFDGFMQSYKAFLCYFHDPVNHVLSYLSSRWPSSCPNNFWLSYFKIEFFCAILSWHDPKATRRVPCMSLISPNETLFFF